MIKRYPVLCLLFVVAMAALLSIFSKQTLTRVDALTFTWLQVCLGIVILLLYITIFKPFELNLKLSVKGWGLLVVIALLNFVASRIFFLLGLQHLSVVSHAYLINFTGIVTMFFSIILLRQYPSLLQWLGAFIAVIGINIYFSERPQNEELVGIFFTSLVVVSLALTNNLVKVFLNQQPEVSPGLLSVFSGLIGGGIWAVIGIINTTSRSALNLDISLFDWTIILANGFFVIALGLTVFNFVLERLASYEVSLLASSGVIFSAIFSWLIVGNKLLGYQVMGIIVLFIGLGLVQIRVFHSK